MLFFSGTFSASEYLRSASRTLYFGCLFSLPSICAAPRGLLQDSSMTLFFSGTFSASEYLRSASRTLYFDCLFSLPSICAAPRGLLQDSSMTPFFSGTFSASDYLRSASRSLYFGRLFSLPSICAAPRGLLQDSSMTLFFSGTFSASEYLRSASRTLVGLLKDSLFQPYFPPFRVSFQRSPRTLYFGRTFPLSSICAAPRGLYLEYLRKVLVHGLIYAISSTCAKG